MAGGGGEGGVLNWVATPCHKMRVKLGLSLFETLSTCKMDAVAVGLYPKTVEHDPLAPIACFLPHSVRPAEFKPPGPRAMQQKTILGLEGARTRRLAGPRENASQGTRMRPTADALMHCVHCAHHAGGTTTQGTTKRHTKRRILVHRLPDTQSEWVMGGHANISNTRRMSIH